MGIILIRSRARINKLERWGVHTLAKLMYS